MNEITDKMRIAYLSPKVINEYQERMQTLIAFTEEVYNIFEIEETQSYQDALEVLKVIKVAAKYHLGGRGERKFLGRSFNELSQRMKWGQEDIHLGIEKGVLE